MTEENENIEISENEIELIKNLLAADKKIMELLG